MAWPDEKTLKRLVYRAWFYFRTGYSNYVSLPLGFASTVVVLYSLAVKPVVENNSGGLVQDLLRTVFPHLVNFLIIGSLVLVPICVFFGLVHFKRIGAYAADISIITEQNPYIRKILPGKESEVFLPLWLLTAKMVIQPSPEHKRELETAIRKAEALLAH